MKLGMEDIGEEDLDHQVRRAAFEFLAQKTQVHGEVLPRTLLAQGFAFRGNRVPLIGPKESVEKVVGESGQMGGQKKWSELTEKQAAVLEIIRENPEASRGKLAQSLSINPSAVQKHIEKLKHRGFIRRVGPDKGGRWEILRLADDGK